MKSLIIILLFYVSISSGGSISATVNMPDDLKINAKLGSLHLPFIENKGQIAPEIAFYTQTFGGTFYVSKQGELFLSMPAGDDTDGRPAVLHEVLKNARITKVNGLEKSRTRINYFKGNDPAKIQSDIPSFTSVSLGEVYKGIEFRLKAYGNNVEKLFYLKAEADPSAIKIAIKGADKLSLNKSGELIVHTPQGDLKYSKPVAYQQIDGKTRYIDADYRVKGMEYTFALGHYDPHKPLVIDPLLQSTYVGGSGIEYAYNMAIHPVTGKVYLVGSTRSDDFPATGSGAMPSHNGGDTDIFIALLSVDLQTLEQATYLGGSGNEEAFDAVVHITDYNSQLYLTGYTDSTDFYGTDSHGSFQSSNRGRRDAFVTRLSDDLSAVNRTTYLGGVTHDVGYAMVFTDHPVPTIYVTGYTESSDFPLLYDEYGQPLGYQTRNGGYKDAFVVRLSEGLGFLRYSTYLGGRGNDVGYDIGIHKTAPTGEEIYIVGYSGYNAYISDLWSGDLPGVAGGAQENFGGQEDVFVARFHRHLNSLFQSTYLGAKGIDHGHSLIIDEDAHEVYIAGYMGVYSSEPDEVLEFTGGAQPTFAGLHDGFAARLSDDLTSLVQGSYIGGSNYDRVYGMQRHASGEIYVSGMTKSPDLPGTLGGVQPSASAYGDAFVTRFRSDLTRIEQSTYFGGSGSDESWWGLAIEPVSGDVYIAGETTSDDLPGITGAAQDVRNGSWEGFAVRLTASLKSNFDISDFTANGSNDLLWHKASTGAVRIMEMNGMIPEANLSVVTSANLNLLPKGIADFTGEGKVDILFHNQNSGNLRIWEMDGTTKTDNIQVLGSSNTNLMIAGVGDFDGDGDTDIATFNTNSGALRMWVMDGTTRVDNVLVLTGANTNLVPRGAGDMNNDGIPDIVLRNNNSGAVRVWTMNADYTRKGNEYVTGSSNTNLELRGVVDINSDGNNDILNYNTNTGKLRAWLMDGNLSITENVEIVQDLDLDWSVRN